jgi:hypothetical protein
MDEFFFGSTNKSILTTFLQGEIQKSPYYTKDLPITDILDEKMPSIFNAYKKDYSKMTPNEFVKNMNNRILEETIPILINTMKETYNKEKITEAVKTDYLKITSPTEFEYNTIEKSELSNENLQRLYGEVSLEKLNLERNKPVIPIETSKDSRKDLYTFQKSIPQHDIVSNDSARQAQIDLYHKAYNKRENKVEYNVYVDSRDRNREIYPDTNYYIVELLPPSKGSSLAPKLNQSYKDILSIEIIEVTIPFCPVEINEYPAFPAPIPLVNPILAPLNNQPYVLLEISEITGKWDGTNKVLAKGPVKIYPDKDRYGYITCFPKFHIIYPRSSLGNLKRMSVRFLNPDGTLFNFPSDTVLPNPVDDRVQNLITLRITTLEAEPDFVI